MTKKLISAWTAPGSSYPQYINLSADGDDVVVVVRSAPETVEGVRVCGATCHPGEFGCNNYCGLCAQGTPIPDAPKSHSVLREGATATMRLPRNVLQEALEILAQPPASVSPGTKGEARSEPKASQHPIRGEGELLPCPFDGFDAEVRRSHDEFGRPRVVVVCRACDSRSGAYLHDSQAVTEWNRRAHPPTSYGKVEELREAIMSAMSAGLGSNPSQASYERTVGLILQALQHIGGRTE